MTPKPRPLSSRDADPTRGRPTPVRELMEGGGGEAPESMRAFEVEGEEWIARVLGSASAGTAPDVRAPLLLVGFARAPEPDAIDREAMAAAASIDDLSDDDLVELLARSREAQRSEAPVDRGRAASM